MLYLNLTFTITTSPILLILYPQSTSNTDSALHIHEVSVPSPSIIPEPHPSMSLHSTPPSLSQSPNSLTSSTQSTPSTTSSCLQEPPHRKSQRAKRPPAWMKDFVCPQLTNKQTTIPPSVEPSTSHSFTITSYPLFSYANLAHFSPSYVASLTKILQSLKPISYAQAKLCLEWVKAMEIELAALEQNNTWQLTTLPPGKKALASKWVYNTKFRPDGSIERHKARLVIRGFEQVKDKDYKHTFRPVAKRTTVRLFIALAVAKDWDLHQLDINNAFLHGFMEEEVYLQPPQGYFKALPGQVCQLQRSLYGLKQAFKQWNIELTKFLLTKGFTQSKNDYSLFTKQAQGKHTFVPVYVLMIY